MDQLVGRLPTPVQIHPAQITSKIAINHTVNIDHRKYAKSVIFEKPIFLNIEISYQLPND